MTATASSRTAATPEVHVVIGGGSGIGRRVCERLAGDGAIVAALDRDAASAAATAELVGKLGGRAIACTAEITDRASLDAAIALVLKETGRIDGLVNCAGITGRTNLKPHEVDPDEFDEVYRINLKGPLLATQAVIPTMLKQNYGRILHIASVAGKDGNAGMTAYSATKAGVIGLVKSMGKDYAETGITINALAPAVIQTPMVDALPQATIDYMTAKIPMRRTGSLDEVAAMVAFIVSPQCSFTTGFCFDLTGGRATY